MTDAKIHESIWIALDEGLLEELRAFGRAQGLSLHDVCRLALGLGIEVLKGKAPPRTDGQLPLPEPGSTRR